MSKYKSKSPNHNSKYKCNFEIMSFKINGTNALVKWLLQAGRQALRKEIKVLGIRLPSVCTEIQT